MYFSVGRDNYGLRENSEMVVSDACLKGNLNLDFVKVSP